MRRGLGLAALQEAKTGSARGLRADQQFVASVVADDVTGVQPLGLVLAVLEEKLQGVPDSGKSQLVPGDVSLRIQADFLTLGAGEAIRSKHPGIGLSWGSRAAACPLVPKMPATIWPRPGIKISLIYKLLFLLDIYFHYTIE